MNQQEFELSLEKNADSFLQAYDLTSAIDDFLAKEECSRIIEAAFSMLKGGTPERAKHYVEAYSKDFNVFFEDVRKCFKLLVRITLPERKEDGQKMKSAFVLNEAQYVQELMELCGRRVRRNGHF